MARRLIRAKATKLIRDMTEKGKANRRNKQTLFGANGTLALERQTVLQENVFTGSSLAFLSLFPQQACAPSEAFSTFSSDLAEARRLFHTLPLVLFYFHWLLQTPSSYLTVLTVRKWPIKQSISFHIQLLKV